MIYSLHPSNKNTSSNKDNTNVKTKQFKRDIVEEHIKYFATKEDILTTHSMCAGHYIQNISDGVRLKARTIKNMMCPYAKTVETLKGIENPASTGFWRSDGTFNEEDFNKFVEGKTLIMKQHFIDYLKEKHGDINHGNACHIYYFIPVSWQRITKGSIDELFLYYADTTHNNKPAFTIQKLKEFYTNPNKVMDQRKMNVLKSF